MRRVLACLAAVLYCAIAQAAGIDALKSLDLGDFEITRIIEAKSPSDLGLGKAGDGKAGKPVVCVEISAKKGSDSRVKMNIALPLPENWNKIYLAKGNGGLGDRTSADQAYHDAIGGYATSHNDLGTDGWKNNPHLKSVVADFGHRAIYHTALVSKKVIAAYYGENSKYCYYSGGSTGGQEGLSLAERHPEMFDGIAVLFPVTNRTRLHTRFAYERKILSPKLYFSPKEIEEISDAIVAQNRGAAGEYPEKAYPFLKYPENARCDYSKLTFLTPEQIGVLKKIHDTVKNSHGDYITVGLVPSAELADNGKSLLKGYTGDWIYPMALGAAYSVADVNFDADLKRVEDLFAEDSNALPNLENFRKLGHKLIIIQGKLDTVVPARYVKEYYDTAASRNGGIDKARGFARVFFMPGMWHGNMTNCNPLSYVQNWVEKGVVPRTIEIGVRYKANLYQQRVDVY
jgi:feruloyl esterase